MTSSLRHSSNYPFVGEHDDDLYLFLPNHLPEVSTGVFEGPLGNDVMMSRVLVRYLGMETWGYGGMETWRWRIGL